MPGLGQSVGTGASTGASLGSIVPGIGTGIGALIGGGIGLAAGLFQKKEGNKLLKKAGEETVPEDILRNQTMAASMANQGLPSEQYAQAMKNIQRQQLMALRGAQDRRGGLAALSGTQQAANDALLKLDSADAQQKILNQRQLMNVNSQVGGLKHNIWERQYNYAQGLRGYGNQNIVGGLDKLAAGGGALAYGLMGSGGGRTKAAPFTMTEDEFQRD